MLERWRNKFVYFVIAQLIFFSSLNQSAFGVTVTTDQLKETSVTYNKKKEKIFCLKTVPGSIVTRSNKITFTPFNTTLLKTPRRNTTKYNRLKALVSLGTKECKRIANTTPGSSPSPTPTATPTPTSAPTSGNFDLQGNVTPAGKILFGIPSSLTANVSAGKAVQTAKCTGCHLERTGRSFLDIRNSIKRSPMLFDEAQIPDPMLANLVAYLNRFRQ